MASLREKAIALVSETAVADLSSVTATTLYTVPTAKVFQPLYATLRVAGDVGANLVCSIGSSGTPTDFVGSTNGDNLDASGDFIILAPVPSATPTTLKEYAAATAVVFNVSVGGNAVAGTVRLFGIIDDA